QKAGGYRNGAAGIQHVDHWLAVVWRDLDRGMRAARRPAPQQQRQLETVTLHLARHMHHLIKRRSDQPTEADHVRLFRLGAFEDLFAGDHHPQVDYLIVIAREHNADDILSNIVHVAFDRSEDDFAL